MQIRLNSCYNIASTVIWFQYGTQIPSDDDRGIVILKNSGNRDLNMINNLWKKNFAVLFKNYHHVLTNGIWSEWQLLAFSNIKN